MKLRPHKREVDHITAYRLTIGSREAKDAGLVGEDGELYEIEKVVGQDKLVIRRKDEKQMDQYMVDVDLAVMERGEYTHSGSPEYTYYPTLEAAQAGYNEIISRTSVHQIKPMIVTLSERIGDEWSGIDSTITA